MSDLTVSQQLQHYFKLAQQKEDLEAELQKALGDIRLAAGRSTFQIDDKWYQVRMRNGLKYMCLLDGPPRGRPRKNVTKLSASE